MTPDDNVSSEVRDLIKYLVRTCILHHRIENQIAVYESHVSQVLTPYSPPDSNKHRNSLKNSASINFTSQEGDSYLHSTSLHHFSRETIPRDFVLVLKRKLQKTLGESGQCNRRHQNDKFSNPVTRKIMVDFTAALTNRLNETSNRLRRPEDLIILFCTKAHVVILAMGSENEKLETHLIVFIQYLIDVLSLSRKGYYYTYKSLIRRLEAYLNRLKKGQALEPAVTYASANDSFKQNFSTTSVQRTKKLIPNPDITFNIADMGLAQFVSELFNVSQDYIQSIIDELFSNTVEKSAIDDLVRCKKCLERSDLHPTYAPGDFKTPEAYARWKLDELQRLTEDIESLKDAIPIYKSLEDEYPGVDDVYDCIYIPRYPIKYYHTIISMCMKSDKSTGNSEFFQFSTQSSSLLEKVMMHWRLTPVSEAMIFLQEATKCAKTNFISFHSLTTNVFPYAMEGLKTTQGNEDISLLHLQDWTSYEKAIAYMTMTETLELCISEILDLLDLNLRTSQPEFDAIIMFLDEFVIPFSAFNEFPQLKINESHYMAVKERIAYISDITFEQQIQMFPPVILDIQNLSFQNLLKLMDIVKKTTSRIYNRYKRIALFDVIDLAGLATRFYVTSFFNFLSSKVLQKDILDHGVNCDLDACSYEEFDDILECLSSIVAIYEETLEVNSKPNQKNLAISAFIKLRKLLAALLLMKIELSSDTLLEWVSRIFQEDSFIPLPDSQISSSVLDLFSSFSSLLKVITNSKWNSSLMNAEFSTAAIRGISQAFLYYNDLLLASLKNDLFTPEKDSKQAFASRQEKWLSAVQNAMSAQYEEITPFNFDARICVKLNDIAWAQNKLREIEVLIDSENKHAVLEQHRAKKILKRGTKNELFWFTIRIIRAKDLLSRDTNGLSDPYVVVSRNDKYIGKTKTIFENLDPVWDETIEIEQNEAAGVAIIQTQIWDENSFTKHSLCGQAQFVLDPKEYQDFVPVEKWLAISPKGSILVSVTMESEKDDICYYFEKCMRRAVLSEDEIIGMIVSKFSSLISFYVSKSTVNNILGVGGYKSIFSGMLKKGQKSKSSQDSTLDEDKIANSLDPLFEYLNANFAALSQNLTKSLRDKVMIQTWNALLEALELILMPPLSDKKTTQAPLSENELTIVRIWSDVMLLFFHNDGYGIPLDKLKSIKYNSFFIALSYYYSADTQDLIKECTDRALDSIIQLIESEEVTVSGKVNGTEKDLDLNNPKSISADPKSIDVKKLKRASSSVEQSKELEILLLRMLRMRGENEFVKRLLNQKTNLAVSQSSS